MPILLVAREGTHAPFRCAGGAFLCPHAGVSILTHLVCENSQINQSDPCTISALTQKIKESPARRQLWVLPLGGIYASHRYRCAFCWGRCVLCRGRGCVRMYSVWHWPHHPRYRNDAFRASDTVVHARHNAPGLIQGRSCVY